MAYEECKHWLDRFFIDAGLRHYQTIVRQANRAKRRSPVTPQVVVSGGDTAAGSFDDPIPGEDSSTAGLLRDFLVYQERNWYEDHLRDLPQREIAPCPVPGASLREQRFRKLLRDVGVLSIGSFAYARTWHQKVVIDIVLEDDDTWLDTVGLLFELSVLRKAIRDDIDGAGMGVAATQRLQLLLDEVERNLTILQDRKVRLGGGRALLLTDENVLCNRRVRSIVHSIIDNIFRAIAGDIDGWECASILTQNDWTAIAKNAKIDDVAPYKSLLATSFETKVIELLKHSAQRYESKKTGTDLAALRTLLAEAGWSHELLTDEAMVLHSKVLEGAVARLSKRNRYIAEWLRRQQASVAKGAREPSDGPSPDEVYCDGGDNGSQGEESDEFWNDDEPEQGAAKVDADWRFARQQSVALAGLSPSCQLLWRLRSRRIAFFTQAERTDSSNEKAVIYALCSNLVRESLASSGDTFNAAVSELCALLSHFDPNGNDNGKAHWLRVTLGEFRNAFLGNSTEDFPQFAIATGKNDPFVLTRADWEVMNAWMQALETECTSDYFRKENLWRVLQTPAVHDPDGHS